ncbi:hypothetical protein [Flavobacterium haoranii]|uniref:hypothetical protein n=1 Tax=Flavobacterium haoranii TaxID=683124 RepID=UPI0009347EA4|nr:hypothetical protein [Flavobacterium haoranii]
MSNVFSILVIIGILTLGFSFYSLFKGFKTKNNKRRNLSLLGIFIGFLLCFSPILFIIFAFLFGGSYHE